MDDSWLTEEELRKLHFKKIGSNVRISRTARLYGSEQMAIGNNVRVDDFCLLSGKITIGDHVHIAAYVGLHGRYGIVCEDFCGISAKTTILSGSDDYSGDYLTNPTVPEEFTKVDGRPVHIGRHCLVGVGSVIFPGVTMGEGACLGSLSLAKNDLEPWGIYAGIPCHLLKPRKKGLLKKEEELRSRERGLDG